MSVTIPPGAGMSQAIDLLVQEAIVLGFGALESDRRAVDELVDRSDSLRHNTADAWRVGLRDALLDMLSTSSPNRVDVLLGYPSGPPGSAHLPCVSIVKDGGGENPSEVCIGDVLDQRDEFVGPNLERVETVTHGAGWTSTLQVGAWTTTPELSALLHAAIGWALQHQKQRLMDMGVHESTWNEGGAPGTDLEPRVGFVPMWVVTLNWTRQQTFRRKVANRVTFTTTPSV